MKIDYGDRLCEQELEYVEHIKKSTIHQLIAVFEPKSSFLI